MLKKLILSLLVTASVPCHAMDHLEFMWRGLKDMETISTMIPLLILLRWKLHITYRKNHTNRIII